MGEIEVRHLDTDPEWTDTFLEAEPVIENRHLNAWTVTNIMLSSVWVTDDDTEVIAYQ